MATPSGRNKIPFRYRRSPKSERTPYQSGGECSEEVLKAVGRLTIATIGAGVGALLAAVRFLAGAAETTPTDDELSSSVRAASSTTGLASSTTEPIRPASTSLTRLARLYFRIPFDRAALPMAPPWRPAS